MELFQRVRLLIVRSDAVLPHEIADPSRERRIEQRIADDQILRDPIVVGSLNDLDRYVLLDGTNRQRALANLGLPWIMVQVVDYGDEHAVGLRTWCHEASMPIDELLGRAAQVPSAGAKELAPLAVGDEIRAPGTLAVILDRNHQYALTRNVEEPVSRAEQLRALVDIYEDRMQRVDCSPDSVEEKAQTLPAQGPSALIAFPPFTRSQVVTMAMRGTAIPAGITRHVIRQGRALRVNLPLEVLAGDDLEAANRRLREHLQQLQPRLYREPTILFDG